MAGSSAELGVCSLRRSDFVEVGFGRYLESIFSAGDIKKQLPIESVKFMDIDQHWRNIMKETNDYSVALVAGIKPGRLEQFREFNETLDQIQKSLEEYLHSKRKVGFMITF